MNFFSFWYRAIKLLPILPMNGRDREIEAYSLNVNSMSKSVNSKGTNSENGEKKNDINRCTERAWTGSSTSIFVAGVRREK